jgi:hypothetical protein
MIFDFAHAHKRPEADFVADFDRPQRAVPYRVDVHDMRWPIDAEAHVVGHVGAAGNELRWRGGGRLPGCVTGCRDCHVYPVRTLIAEGQHQAFSISSRACFTAATMLG